MVCGPVPAQSTTLPFWDRPSVLPFFPNSLREPHRAGRLDLQACRSGGKDLCPTGCSNATAGLSMWKLLELPCLVTLLINYPSHSEVCPDPELSTVSLAFEAGSFQAPDMQILVNYKSGTPFMKECPQAPPSQGCVVVWDTTPSNAFTCEDWQ